MSLQYILFGLVNGINSDITLLIKHLSELLYDIRNIKLIKTSDECSIET